MCKNTEECKSVLTNYQFDLRYINTNKAEIYLDYMLLPYEDTKCCKYLDTQQLFLRISFLEHNHQPLLITDNNEEVVILDLCLEDELKLAWYLYFQTLK